MSLKRFLYVDVDGDYTEEEISGAFPRHTINDYEVITVPVNSQYVLHYRPLTLGIESAINLSSGSDLIIME